MNTKAVSSAMQRSTIKKVDKGQSAGGRIRAIYLPSDNWKLDFNVSYEYGDQGGYPYGLYNKETGDVAKTAYNDESSYYRNLLNAGLNVEYQAQNFTLSAVTGYQTSKGSYVSGSGFHS